MNEKIKRIMAKSFEVPIETINDNSTKDDIESWDSLHHIMMVVELERAFAINIPDERVGNMISFNLIKSIVYECFETHI